MVNDLFLSALEFAILEMRCASIDHLLIRSMDFLKKIEETQRLRVDVETLDIWIPHKLKVKNLRHRTFISESALKQTKISHFWGLRTLGTTNKATQTMADWCQVVAWGVLTSLHRLLLTRNPIIVRNRGRRQHSSGQFYSSREVLMHPSRDSKFAGSIYSFEIMVSGKKMANGYRPEWHIFGVIKFIYNKI